MGYAENTYRVGRIGGKYLLTTDHGSWVSLDRRQFGMLQKGRVGDDPGLFRLLKEKGFIVTDDNKGGIIEKLREKYAFLWQGTSLHIVIPTLRCNGKCMYCHASSRPINSKEFDMDKRTARATVDFIFQSPSRYIMIEFQGGEPLLNFGMVKYIVEYAKEVNKSRGKTLLFSLVTNFSRMNREIMEYLVGNGIGICTSLDGPEWLHNKNRPLPGSGGKSHYLARKWIRAVTREYEDREMKGRRANALITITRNSLGCWREIIDEYVEAGLKDIFLRFLNNLGDARKVWKDISYSPEDFIEFWKRSMDYIIELNMRGKVIRERLTVMMLKKIVENSEPNFLDQRSPCGAAIGQLAYDYNGDIYTCDEARMVGDEMFVLGNVRRDRYRDIMGSGQVCGIIASSVNDTQICDSCVFKPYCGICPVCNYAEQGSIIGKIPGTKRCRIYKAQFEYVFDKIMNDKEAGAVLLGWLKDK